jgi:hypothetical protein
MDAIPEQPINAVLLIDVTELGILMEVRLVQLLKVESLIEVIEFGITIEERLLQS